MKKIILISMLFLITVFSQAQQAKKIHSYNSSAGNFIAFDSKLTDTLKSADTVSYVFYVNHNSRIAPIMDLREKLISGDTTVILTVLESFDGITYSTVYAGTLGSTSAYTKTLAKSITQIQYDGIVDQAWFGTIYIKYMFVSPVTTANPLITRGGGFKKILSGYIGFIGQ